MKHVKVELCEQLKILFPIAIAKTLNQLQYLEISDCDAMEAVICNNGAHEIQTDAQSGQPNFTSTGVGLVNLYAQTLFPQLQTLKLKNLKNIRSLTQPCFLLDFPNLEHLTVLSCPHLRFPLGPKSLQKLIAFKAERMWFEELDIEDNKTKVSLQKCFTDIST